MSTENADAQKLKDAAEAALDILRDTVANSDRQCIENNAVRSSNATRLYQRAVVVIAKLEEALK